MSSTNYVYSENGFKSEDTQILGQFSEFGGLSGHLKRVIMEGFSSLALIALVEADPSVSDLAKDVMKRKVLKELHLESDLEAGALQVTLCCDGETDCVTFPSQSGIWYEDVEMYRKAYTFILRICSAMNTVNTTMFIDANRATFPRNLDLLQLPSMDKVLMVKTLFCPADAPVDFTTQVSTHDANDVCYEFPHSDPYEAMHYFVQMSLSSPRI